MTALNTLKNLFSKLKPAANAVANYGDDAAKAVANYGDDLAEFASLEQLDPNAYKSGLDSTPDYESLTINPEDFRQRKDLIDSVDYPDGFTNPDDFARYYDSLELGYVPKGFNLNNDNDEFFRRLVSDTDDDVSLAYNLLKQQELHMPMSPRTFDQAHMLVKKRSQPNSFYLRNGKDVVALYDLYKDILNYKKPW